MAFLIDDILLSPVHLAAYLGEKLREVAESEVMDEGAVRGELLELQMRLEMEEITDEEYLKKEQELVEKLSWIRRYYKEAK